jgi:pilus assembly protein CpaB
MYRRIIFIALALVIGAAGTAGVGFYARSADSRALAGHEVVEAYIAVDAVPEGTSAQDALANGLIELEQLSAKGVPDGALTEVDSSIEDLVTQANVPAGSIVLRDVFGERKQVAQTGGLIIPTGKVAISIKLQDQSGQPIRLPGLVVGSQVAVFNTFNVYEGKGAPRENTPSGNGLNPRYEYVQATRLVISRAEVIAIGEPGSDDDNGSDDDAMSVVTLAVSQSETERLAQVALTGHPSLALLGPDSHINPGGGVDNRSLFDFGETK